MAFVRAGSLNRGVEIQQSSAPEIGEPFPTGWTTLATVWADVRHQSGVQSIKSGADVSVVKASIRIRRRTDVTAGMRVLVDGNAYDIRAVLDDVAGRVYCDLVCELGANSG